MEKKDGLSFSVVVPFYNEEENVRGLHQELILALEGYEYELIYVDDGSKDSTLLKLREALSNQPAPYSKLICMPKNLGQSFAFKAGLNNSRFPIVVFMDGDAQNDPLDIPRLLDKIKAGYDLVQGVRHKRKDGFFTRILPSFLANAILRVFCGSQFRDIGCSLKAFKKDLAAEMAFQQGMHRILPVYFCLSGAKVSQMHVNHRKRIHGKTKYGFSRTFEVLFEIIKINFFEKNSNRFLFATGALSFIIFSYAMVKGVLKFTRYPEDAIVYFILSALSIYVFIISAILYISRSFYIYYKQVPILTNISVESYGKKAS